MRLIPVIDILNRVVVRGVAGQRDQYRPIQSALTGQIDPISVARAIRERYGFQDLYVADLDAITAARPALDIYRALQADGFQLWIDAGISNPAEARALASLEVEQAVVGLESCPSPDALREILDSVTPQRVTFSLDLKHGQPLADPAWGDDPEEIARIALALGVTQIIVLDLAAVGVGGGVPTVELCDRIRRLGGASLQMITGGGVRDVNDLKQLESHGVDGVLIASALHLPDSWVPARE